jgi:hypothetical protein
VRYVGTQKPKRYAVKDMLGRTTAYGAASNDTRIDAAALPAGTYMIELLDEGGTIARARFVVLK